MKFDWCDNCNERRAVKHISMKQFSAYLCGECLDEWENGNDDLFSECAAERAMCHAEHKRDLKENR